MISYSVDTKCVSTNNGKSEQAICSSSFLTYFLVISGFVRYICRTMNRVAADKPAEVIASPGRRDKSRVRRSLVFYAVQLPPGSPDIACHSCEGCGDCRSCMGIEEIVALLDSNHATKAA